MVKCPYKQALSFSLGNVHSVSGHLLCLIRNMDFTINVDLWKAVGKKNVGGNSVTYSLFNQTAVTRKVV